MKPVLLTSGPIMGALKEALEGVYEIVQPWKDNTPEPVLVKVCNEVQAIISTGNRPVDAALIKRCPKLRIISHFGVGYDAVDVSAAASQGVIVTNTPDVLSDEVADTCIGLLLMTVRELSRAERWMRDGNWPKHGSYPLSTHSLRDRSFGIVGLGRIGRTIAKRLEGFERPISYFSRTPKNDVSYTYYSNLDEMAAKCDTLIIITPGGDETKHLVNADVLRALGPRGIVINLARGSVVDEAALLVALKGKTIAAAGLDVFMNEPAIDPAFFTLDNCTVLPHVGSASRHTRTQMANLVAANLKAFLQGEPPVTPVPETPFAGWKEAA